MIAMVCVVNGNATEPIDHRCTLPLDENRNPGPVDCLAYMPQYGYDSVTKKCEHFIYGGCGGNDNKFDTKRECEELCVRGE
ncbi:hypothetical protein PYW08_011202 [Mythimna loreyi]|uniref:Uncharacterized protein n=1 Tax=Mythimna loreyi TaxID=667449 RepID=A0ACC2Q7Q6_9NEOP|nr:hypothetical protein PYW08_011202 [Mythimna loreyi]